MSLNDQLKDLCIDKLRDLYLLSIDNNEYDNVELLAFYNNYTVYLYGSTVPILTDVQLKDIKDNIERIIIDKFLNNEIQSKTE